MFGKHLYAEPLVCFCRGQIEPLASCGAVIGCFWGVVVEIHVPLFSARVEIVQCYRISNLDGVVVIDVVGMPLLIYRPFRIILHLLFDAYTTASNESYSYIGAVHWLIGCNV